MSTQSYTPHHQAPSRPGHGPSWFRIWAVVVGTAVAVTFIVLAVGLSHGRSGTAPATNGTPASTSVPAHPTTPVTPPAHPTTPVTPTHPA